MATPKRRRRCAVCHHMCEQWYLEVSDDASFSRGLLYVPGHQPRGLPSRILCKTCAAENGHNFL